MAEFTPMMQQYWQVKQQNQDAILFYRLGDFYEMFFEDAPYVFEVEGFGIVASYFFSDGNHLSPSFIVKCRWFPSSQWSARYSTRSTFAIM